MSPAMIERAILHVDMDAFYASVEQRDHPELRGRPVMVGGNGHRGVVAAASYEARQFGVRSAMPAVVARRLCPEGVFVAPRFSTYKAVSEKVFALFHDRTSLVEGLSLDEAFLDMSHKIADVPSLLAAGREIKQAIAAETGLTASIGMAHNKLIAKLASDYDKPDGLVHIPSSQVARFLDPLPVRRLWGIGPRSASRLHDSGILTIGQLRRTSHDVLTELFGQHGPALALRAAGIDDRPVKPSRTRRSISQESTFDQDIRDINEVRPHLSRQATEVARRLLDKNLHARTVTIKLRSSGFSTITRSQSLPDPTRSAEQIEQVAWDLLRHWTGWRQSFAIRLVGVGVSGLAQDPDLVDGDRRQR